MTTDAVPLTFVHHLAARDPIATLKQENAREIQTVPQRAVSEAKSQSRIQPLTHLLLGIGPNCNNGKCNGAGCVTKGCESLKGGDVARSRTNAFHQALAATVTPVQDVAAG